MKKLLFLLATISLLTPLTTACTGGNQAESEPASDAAATGVTETPTEMPTEMPTETAAEEGVAIALISPEAASVPMGDAVLVLQVADAATNEPLEVENLAVDLSMPMDGMDPMTTMALVEAGESPGQYKVTTNLGMAGLWIMTVKSADAAMPAQATFNLNVK